MADNESMMEVSYQDYEALSFDRGSPRTIYDCGASPRFTIKAPLDSACVVALFDKMAKNEKVIVRDAPTTGDGMYLVWSITRPINNWIQNKYVEIEFGYAGKLEDKR